MSSMISGQRPQLIPIINKLKMFFIQQGKNNKKSKRKNKNIQGKSLEWKCRC